MKKPKNKVVEIWVEGGLIQDMKLPKGVSAIVRDYDIEGSEDDDRITKDKNGRDCFESVWE